MKKYRLIRKEVDAIQFTGDNLDEIRKWLADMIIADLGEVFAIRGLDGYTLEKGNYIVVKGGGHYNIDLIIMQEQDFEGTYEKVYIK
jgi:hypothetical protein